MPRGIARHVPRATLCAVELRDIPVSQPNSVRLFGVILITLVGLGLTQPRVVKLLDVTRIEYQKQIVEHDDKIIANREVISCLSDIVEEDH